MTVTWKNYCSKYPKLVRQSSRSIESHTKITLNYFIANPNLYKISFVWCLDLVKRCEEQQSPHNTVVSFGLKLATACHKFDTTINEQIISQAVMSRTLTVINGQEKLRTPSVLLSYVLLLKEVTKTESGLMFLRETALWSTLINYQSPNFTIYIIREMSSFLYEILKAFDAAGDEAVVKDVLKEIFGPLLNSIWIGTDHAVRMDDPDTKEIIYKMLYILEVLLFRMIDDADLSHIPYYLFIEMGLENKLWKLRDISLTEEFSKKMILVIAIANCVRFTCMKIPSKDTTTQQLMLEKFCINFYNFLNFAIMRNSADIVLAITDITTRLWYKQSPRRPTEELITTHKLKFGDQMLMIQLMPLLYVIKKESPSATDADYIDEFCQGMFSLSCEHTIRYMYAVRDVLRQNKKSNTDLACRAITRISSSGAIIEKPRALIAFRSFICSITEFLPTDFDISQSNSAYLSFDNPHFLLSLLTGVNSMIKTYDITCADCPISSLHKICLYMLCVVGLNTQHKVQVIKMLENAMVRFSSNQVPLMIGDLSGSGYEHLGSVIYKHLYDIEWDVRDSILELISAIIQISCTKFPVLQNLFLEQNFCDAIVTMTKTDAEPYVRASALKCLKAMIRVNKFWGILQETDLIKYLCELLLSEEEAIVRREAVDALFEVYMHQRSPKSALVTILPTMIYCGAMDLHWEVRINALKFWDRTLEKCFIAEGYSDGSFPTQIFSTKLRKIVKLDQNSIKTKIGSALDEFGRLGGFGVVLANLEETTDTEVMKVAVQIITKLNKRLEKYDFKASNQEEPSEEPPLKQVKVTTESSPVISETILDSVVDSDDINLLISTHHNALTNDKAGQRYDETICQPFTKITANHFLNAVHDRNFESHIESKINWNDYTTDSFESLLDDILYSFKEYETNHTDVNGMDCY